MPPPVFVMNPYYSGLGIARAMHGSGVPVYALTSERDTAGAASRCFHAVFEVPNGRDEPERLRDRLMELSASFPERPVLFPTRDFDVLFLAEHGEALRAAYRLPQPPDSPILRIMDKLALARLAEEQGIATPATSVCRSEQDLEREIAGLQFPLIVKPRFAYQWRRSGLWEKVGGVKAIVVESADELRMQQRRLSELVPEVLLQRYVAGEDENIVVCGCYVDRDGRLLGHFTGRKLRQNPPLVGTGSVVEATDVPDIVGPSVRLLRAFGYSGLAEVEFKYDRTVQKHLLIEINPRHWDQHELGLRVGVNLTQIAYADQVGMQMAAAVPVYMPGRKHRWVAERELMYAAAKDFSRQVKAHRAAKGLLRAVIGAALQTLGDLRAALQGEKMFSTLRLRDPRPGIRMCRALLREALRFVGAPMKALVTLQIIASALISLPASPAYAQQGPYDLQMLPVLPAYCRNAQGYRERVPGADNAAEIERWNKLMGQSNFHHIHHYCIGLANTHRALYRPLTKRERSWELEVSIKEFDYVISRATPDFVLLAEILTKRGENLLRLGRTPEAISTLMRAIDTKPDYWPPYAALSDRFKEAGQLDEARAWLERGLAASPGAAALQRRSKELSPAAH